MICSWACLPSSSATTLAHAFSTPTKVTVSGCKHSCCICQNRSNAFCPCPHFTCPNIMAVQETTLRDGGLLNTLQASSIPPTFDIHVNQATSHKHISFQWSVDELVCPLKCSRTSTCIEHRNKSEPVRNQAFKLHFFEEFYRLLMLPCLASFLFQEKLSNCRVPGSIAASSATSHVGVCRSPSQSASCVFFLRLKSGRAFFSGLQSHHCEGSEKNSRQSFSLACCCCGGCGSNRSTPIRG